LRRTKQYGANFKVSLDLSLALWLFVSALSGPILPFAVLAIVSFGVSALAQAPTSSPGFSLAGSLHDARVAHTATLLNDGRVLVAGGGQGPDWLDGYYNVPGAELFDPVSGGFTPAGTFARQSHTGTLLQSGKVLLAGGEELLLTATAESELYDPVTGQFQPTGSLVVARECHTATLLQDGRVLIVGGTRSQDLSWVPLSDAEIYDPVTGTFSLTGSLHDARFYHTATLLPDGRVLITGGSGALDSLASAELYDPATGVFTRTGNMSVKRGGPVATLLLDGHVLITGYEPTPELYDPATGSFEATGSMLVPRGGHTANLLKDGTVLITGGYDSVARTTEIPSEIYDPVKRTFTSGPNLNFPRLLHTATSLSDGSVAIIGGADSPDGIHLKFINSAEIYDVSWQQAIAAIKAAAGSDSQNFWQWAWYWQYLPAFQRAPVGFDTVGSISPGLMEQIIVAGGGDGFRTVSAEQWVLIYRQLTQLPASWQQAITEMKAMAGTDSLSFWQWAWCWQYLPAFRGAPSGFGEAGSIGPGLMEQIILAGGGDGFHLVSAEDWLLYYRRATCAGCGY